MAHAILAFLHLAPVTAALGMSVPPAQAPPSASDALSKLVPAGTVAFVQATSLERLDTLIRRVLAAFEPARLEGFDIDQMLFGEGLPGSPKDIDRRRPIALCLVVPEGAQAAPSLTFLVPATSPESFLRSVRGSGARVTTAVEGGYVSVSLSSDSEPGPAPAPIALGLPAGDLVARIDLEHLAGRLGPVIETGLRELESAMPFAKGTRSIVDSSRRLDIAVTLEGDRFEIAPALTVLEGSAMAWSGSAGKTDVRALARFLDPDAWVGVLVGVDQDTVRKRLLPLVDEALALDPEPARSIVRKLLERAPEIAEQAGSAACVSTDLGDGSLRVSCYLRAVDPGRLMALCEAAILDVPGASSDEPKEAEVDGVHLRRMRIHVDTESFVDARMKGLGDEHKADVKALYARIYGEHGLALTLGTKEGLTAVVLGGDELYLRACLARIPSGKEPPSAVARALAQIGDLDPCFVMTYDAGRVMHGMNELISGTLPEWPFAFPEVSAPFTAWCGVDGLVWRGVISTDLARLESSFRRMHEAAIAAPMVRMKADFDAIGAALIEYAKWHRGQYPPTLTPLLSPNPDRYVYLDMAEVPKDPWGREYRYDPPSAGNKDPHVYTYGRDGKVGGRGEDADAEIWIRKGKR